MVAQCSKDLWVKQVPRRRTHCCRIMGMLTQLAAATAANGTQRATRGGAFCKTNHHKHQ